MSRVVDELKIYLEDAFGEHEISEEWERSRNVFVVRLERTIAEKRETLLVELADGLAESDEAGRLEKLLETQDLATLLREHSRVLVSREGITPLPWKQLAPDVSSVDEASWESFPASDPAPLSSLSRDAPSKGRTH